MAMSTMVVLPRNLGGGGYNIIFIYAAILLVYLILMFRVFQTGVFREDLQLFCGLCLIYVFFVLNFVFIYLRLY